MKIGPIREPVMGHATARVERIVEIKPVGSSEPSAIDLSVASKDAKHVAEKLSEHEVKKVVDGMNVILEHSGSHLKYAYHDKLGEYYVEIVDDRTNEIIKEIPPKRWLDLVATMWEQLGWIIDKKI
ncbi:MAG: flagellar protein FlaG [Candidatus Carbobacillus altaicus]|nr:flagellar protein FlaG [Candidatus Carbobacillus altaicus]